jgi:putative ABC transport system ATP-binding protein
MSAIVRLTDLRKSYRLGSRRVPALNGVSLEIDRGGFYAIMGPSGSGKSTLLHLLAALDRPDAGAIEVAGRRLDTLSEAELTIFRRHNVGIVFQQYNLIPTLTAIENITLPAMLDGMSRGQRDELGNRLVELFGLQGRAHHRPDALSGGEQQRVAIARAMAFQPPVLFADEPTGNLDSVTSEQVWRLLKRLADEQEMTVVMVTHEPAAAVHCRKVFLLHDGVIHNSFETEGLDAAELATRAQQPGR